MDDMLSKITELLSDPSQAEKIRQIADSLAGNDVVTSDGGSSPLPDTPAEESREVSTSVGTDGLMSSFLGGGSSSNGMSRNIALLQAITPYLRPSRAAKISSAIKAIQVIDLLSKAR